MEVYLVTKQLIPEESEDYDGMLEGEMIGLVGIFTDFNKASQVAESFKFKYEGDGEEICLATVTKVKLDALYNPDCQECYLGGCTYYPD